MDWTQSYASTWRVFRVNRDTWADAGRITGIDSVSITRTADGELLESGSIEATGELARDYYRIVMTAEQGSETERVDVATLLFDYTGGETNYGTTKLTIEGRSVLYPASKALISTGEYAPAGVDGAAYAAELLQRAVNAPVETEGSFVLNENIVHEVGSSILAAAWSVLNAGGFIIQITGTGVIRICQKPTAPALVIDSTNTRYLTNGISYTADESEIPNRYIVTDGIQRAVIENSDPESSVSVATRGYYVDKIDESPEPVNGETLIEYATRKLKEESVLRETRSYNREYAPDVHLYSIVRASIDGLEGDLRVTSQNLTCKNGIAVSETAEAEVALW